MVTGLLRFCSLSGAVAGAGAGVAVTSLGGGASAVATTGKLMHLVRLLND